MALRNRSRTTYVSPYLHETVVNSVGTTVFNGGVVDAIAASETMTDDVTPGFFKKKRRGQFLPINYMTHTKTSFDALSGSVDYTVKYNGTLQWTQYWTGHLGWAGHLWSKGRTVTPSYTGSTPSWPSVSPVLTDALAKARTKGWDILTFMLEFEKTVALIARFRNNTLRRAERVADSLKKGAKARRNRGGLSLLNDPRSAPLAVSSVFAEAWLEARYGWRQLFFDAQAVTEAWYKLGRTKPPFVRASSKDSAAGTYSFTYNPSSYMRYVTPLTAAYDYGRCRIDILQTKTRTVRAGVVLEPLLDDIVEIDPLVTAWEVIPFSFIVDWFVNVGDIIAAYSPFATENLLGAWSMSTETLETLCTVTPATVGNPNSGWYYQASNTTPCFSSLVKTTGTREVQSPSANLSFKVNLNGEKVADLVSIFLVRYSGILKDVLKTYRV